MSSCQTTGTSFCILRKMGISVYSCIGFPVLIPGRLNRKQKQKELLVDSPVDLPGNYLQWLNSPESSKELTAIRKSVIKAKPYGTESEDIVTVDY